MINGSYDTRVNPGGNLGIEELLALLEEANANNLLTFETPQQQNQKQGGSNQPSMNQVQQIMDRVQGNSGSVGPGYSSIPINGQEINGMNVHWGPNTGSGLGGSGGGSTGGAATAGYVLAAILGQMAATSDTDTTFEGQPTGNFFSFGEDPSSMTDIGSGNWQPRVFTEPWLAWGHDKLGWDPTIGEKMDAAIYNNDWSTALKRLPAAADYWADPIRSWLGTDTWKNIGDSVFGDNSGVGEVLGFLADPIQGILQQIEDWF